MDDLRRPRIADRQDDYKAMARKMIISPARFDPFELGEIQFWFASFTSDVNSQICIHSVSLVLLFNFTKFYYFFSVMSSFSIWFERHLSLL